MAFTKLGGNLFEREKGEMHLNRTNEPSLVPTVGEVLPHKYGCLVVVYFWKVLPVKTHTHTPRKVVNLVNQCCY